MSVIASIRTASEGTYRFLFNRGDHTARVSTPAPERSLPVADVRSEYEVVDGQVEPRPDVGAKPMRFVSTHTAASKRTGVTRLQLVDNWHKIIRIDAVSNSQHLTKWAVGWR